MANVLGTKKIQSFQKISTTIELYELRFRVVKLSQNIVDCVETLNFVRLATDMAHGF